MKLTHTINGALLFGIIAAAIMTFGIFASTAQADPVLQGYWTFDSDTVASGTFVESSGYQAAGTHDGLIKGTGVSYNPIAGEAGNHLSSGNYISFTNNTYAVIQNSSTKAALDSPNYLTTYDFHGGAFTISAWVKGLPAGSSWSPYIAKYGENNYGYQLRRYSTTTSPTFTYRRSNGDDDPAPNITGAYTNLDDGNWHHLVGVFGGTYRELYMDGQLITRITDSATTAGGEGEPLVFSGRYSASAAAYQAFANISLDDVAIYSGALRNNQITYLNNGGDPTKLEAAEANTINISMATGGKCDKNTDVSYSGKTGHSWLNGETTFYGSSGYLKTNLPVGSAGLNGSFTASVWINMDDISGDQAIFGNTTWGTNNQSLHLLVNNGNPIMGFYNNDLKAADTTLNPNQWYYLTFQYDADSKTQRIFLNGEQVAERTGVTAFAGGKTLEIGRMKETGNSYFRGKMKEVSITDAALSASEIQAMMNADRGSIRVEDFSMGKGTDEWYSGGGSTFGVACSYQNKYCLHSYYNISDGSTSTVSGQSASDSITTALWGPQFTVADELPENAAITFSVAGSATALNFDSRTAGGAGVALWDLTTGDFVRDSSGKIISKTGNSNATWYNASLPLNGLEGHNVMLVAMDRQTNGYGWIGITDLTADISQISYIADAAQHHLVLNNFNFDTAGDFNGMYEIDADGNKLDSVTHFTNGSRNGSAATAWFVDESGTISAGTKGFLSTGTAAYGEEQTTGVLRSDPFLVQGDIMEFLIAGGNNISNKHIDLIDADTEEVYFSATGDNTNNFMYDFWNLKDIQGKSVYLKIVDADGGSSWSHMELDQIRQIKFAPTEAEVAASEKAIKAGNLSSDKNLPGFNAEVYSLDGTGIDSLDALANYITGGAEPDDKLYQFYLSKFRAQNSGIDASTTLDIESAGQYTLAVANDEPIRITLNGETVFESEEGTDGFQFIPLTLSETGLYALDILYLNESGDGASLYAAEGAFDSWDSAFALLSGFGDGYIHGFADYFVQSNDVPEPSTWALLILGAAGLLCIRKRK
ncbi:MAG: PEP-CTERM sorting domain-containing protein [Thermoguttaceae bacterium]|nr:PEP-CTERM sorting domain-containing protein [Thermoguttaceae bacterium]